LRTALFLGGLSFLLAVVWGSPLIRLLKARGIGKKIRIEGPATHQVKAGTPTMGGLMIVLPVLLITAALNIVNLLGATLVGRSILVPMTAMAAFAALGVVDDILGVRGKSGEGLLARTKFPIQVIVALAISLILYLGPAQLRSVVLPSVAQKIDIGPSWVPVAVFIIVSMSNAMNLTDGLDGLAGIIAATAFIAYGIIAYLQSFQIEPYPTFPERPVVSYLVPFSFTVAGACMAFLWFNAHPAHLFMGDTGSEALGATLGVVALMTGQWLLLPIIALIPVAETLSVVLQVGYFKLTKGRRLFKMAPLHNHFVLLGWSETQIVQRFWLVAIWSAMVGIALALL
jgi:phospho-N-acetylmuramoyl-pentapeptide-transferase